MNISHEGKAALADMLLLDPEDARDMSSEKLAEAARHADEMGFDMERFLRRLSGSLEADRVLECVMPVWCECGRAEQLRSALLKLPAGAFSARTIAPVFTRPEDLDFLVRVGRETYRLSQVFLDLDQRLLDALWRARIAKFMERPDLHRAFEEVRRAIRGYSPEPEHPDAFAFEVVIHEEGTASNGLVKEFLARIYTDIGLSPIPESVLGTIVPRRGEIQYTRKTKKGQITITTSAEVPMWEVAHRLFSRGERMLWEPGHQMIAIAKHFGRAQWL